MTALHYAAFHGFEKVIRLLIEGGISTDAVNYVSVVFWVKP